MGVIDWVRRLFGRMLPKKNIEKKLNVQIATSSVMDDAIARWAQMYKNEPPWMGGEYKVKCLNIPASVSEELARLILTEFHMEVGGSPRADFISEQLKPLVSDLSTNVEIWCALGGIVLKPYAVWSDDASEKPDKIAIDVVQADRFYPTAFNSSRQITGAVFVETKRIGDYAYTRLEHHEMSGDVYRVVNKAYRSEKLTNVTKEDNITVSRPLNEEVPLESVDDWAGIQPLTEITGLKAPLWVYIKVPRANNVDIGSPLGASVYARAEGVIEEADRQFSRTIWEYVAKEAAIDADETLFELDKSGKPILPAGHERLFRTYDTGGGEQTMFNVYSPEIRDSAMFGGLNEYFRRIEHLCGLAYGTLSNSDNASSVDRTAEEIKSSKQRSYTSVSKMQSAWQDGLTRLIEAMSAICSLYEIVPDGEIEPVITWGDGVLEDADVEYQRRWSMVISGKMKLEKFYAWYFGCSEEEALDYIPNGGPTYPPEE